MSGGEERATMPGHGAMRPRAAGFTLLEILAVVLIFALLSSIVVPNIGIMRSRALRRQADEIVAQLELARQRAIATGSSHRIFIDLDEGMYRMEAMSDESDGSGEPAFDLETADLFGESPIPLAAPPASSRTYTPLAGRFGRVSYLEDDLAFVGVETPGGWIEKGEIGVAFGSDGTAEYTTVVLDDEAGRSIELEILPLADVVRIHEEG